MVRALELARLGLATTDPNPRVGCVIVAGTRVVGEGWHRRAGGPHAEAIALERAGAAAGISETTAELGGALGIAILGSVGTMELLPYLQPSW